jgi:hypothetical protein
MRNYFRAHGSRNQKPTIIYTDKDWALPLPRILFGARKYFKTFRKRRNRFRQPSLLAGRFETPIRTRFLTPTDFSKFQALLVLA